MPEHGYLRFPTIHGDTVVFACEDDLWIVSAQRRARPCRLTAGRRRGRLSALLAGRRRSSRSSAARRGRPRSTSCRPTAAPARRLTYHGAQCVASPAGRRTARDRVRQRRAGQPFRRGEWLPRVVDRTAACRGGCRRARPARSPTGPTAVIVLGRNTADPAHWKRYRGGTAGDLWVDPSGDGEFRRLVTLDGNLASPCWVGERDLLPVRPRGRRQRLLLHARRRRPAPAHRPRRLLRPQPVAATASGWSTTPAPTSTCSTRRRDEPRRLDVRARAARAPSATAASSPAAALPRTAPRSARTAPAWRSPRAARRSRFAQLGRRRSRQHGEPDGVRYRLLTWLNDGQRLVAAASDDERPRGAGRADRRRQRAAAARWTTSTWAASSTWRSRRRADQVALTNHRNELLAGRSGAPSRRRRAQLDRSRVRPHRRPRLVARRPLAGLRLRRTRRRPRRSSCAEVETGETTLATRPVLRDTARPSTRTASTCTSSASATSTRSTTSCSSTSASRRARGRTRSRCARTCRRRSSPRPKPPESEEADGAQEGRGRGRRRAAAAAIEIDLDGIERPRASPSPCPRARYGRIAGHQGQGALLDRARSRAAADDDWYDDDAAGATARSRSTTSRRRSRSAWSTASPTSGSAATARRCSTARATGCGCSRPARSRPSDGRRRRPAARAAGSTWGGCKVSVQPAAEWRQMFREAWRLQREQFWTEDMAGHRLGRASTSATCRWSTASPPAPSSPTCSGSCRASSAPRTPTRWAASTGPGPNYRQGFLGRRLGLRRRAGGYAIARIVQRRHLGPGRDLAARPARAWTSAAATWCWPINGQPRRRRRHARRAAGQPGRAARCC